MMPKYLESLIRFVRSKLDELGWSDAELARRAKLPTTTISGALKGKRDLTLSTITALAEGLKTTPAMLVASPEERDKIAGKETTSDTEQRIAALEAAISKLAQPTPAESSKLENAISLLRSIRDPRRLDALILAIELSAAQQAAAKKKIG